ncbi:MAG: DUF983 domain-containing protein [Bacteroidetes bacterium HGW-Bacteroidetes-12]|nr:MAG: DUF983 domain-containing protein [Bacteroidetes bacterium HGW-Bacteroidetes-12]
MLPSILKLKCPKCHEGDLFVYKGSYRIKGFFDMPKNCSKCGQDFEIETGFYFGAMYVSYGLTIAISVAVFTALIVFDSYSLELFLLSEFLVLLALLPYVIRVSRAIWIAIIVKYDAKAIDKWKVKNIK